MTLGESPWGMESIDIVYEFEPHNGGTRFTRSTKFVGTPDARGETDADLTVKVQEADDAYLDVVATPSRSATKDLRDAGRLTPARTSCVSACNCEVERRSPPWRTYTWPPTDEPWGVRELHVRHPDGHVFRSRSPFVRRTVQAASGVEQVIEACLSAARVRGAWVALVAPVCV